MRKIKKLGQIFTHNSYLSEHFEYNLILEDSWIRDFLDRMELIVFLLLLLLIFLIIKQLKKQSARNVE